MKNKNNEYIPINRESKTREKEREAPKYLNNIFEFNANVQSRVSDTNS